MSILTKPYFVARKNNGVLFEPDSNTVLWLPGQDDAYSSTIRDRSGQGFNGTITGALWKQNGRGTWYLDFDGVDDIIAVPTNAVFDAMTECSVLAWYKPNVDLDAQATHRNVWTFYLNATNFIQCYYSHTTNEMRLFQLVGNVAKATVGTGGNEGESQVCHFTQCDFGTGGAQMWIDKVSIGTDTEEECVDDIAGAAFNIGTQIASGQPWSGDIALVRIFNAKLGGIVGAGIYQSERHLFGV